MSPDAKSKHVAAALIILSILYVAEVPYLSLLARLLFHTLLLGYLARKPLGLGKSRWVLFESILLSIAVTTCAGMLAGVYLPVAGLASSLLMLAVAWALFLRFGFEKPAIPAEYLNFALIFLFASVPLAIMLLLNPYAGFISDGWWHCPVLNTIRYDGLPPQNPWLSGATLAYPYAYHVFLSYAFGGGLFCLDQFGIFAVLLMFAQALGIYCILAEFGGKKIGKLEALAGSFVFTWASTIGGLFFAWDAITKIPAIGISGFMEFMKTNHGPHMWYGAMKLLFPSGLNIPFQGMAMVGSPQFLLLVGILYFLLKKSEMVGYGIKKSDIGVALCLAPLCAVSPVVGLIAAIALSLFILYERGLAGVAAIGAVGIATFLIDVSYILAVLGKPAVGGGVIGLSPDALPTLLLAAFGISPLLVFAFLGAKEIDAKVRARSLSLMLASVAAVFFTNLGYLYFLPQFMVGLSLLAGPYFARALKLDKKGLIIAAVLLILCIPNLLILASYAYYKPAVDSQQVEAGLWIRENTPENSVFLQKMELGGLGYDELCPGGNPIELSHWDTRQLFAYHSAFGERRGYLGDLRGLYVYGENFCPALLTYFAVFDEKNEGAICGLKAAGVDYVYVSDPSWEPEGRATACLSLVFGNDGARIYEARGLSGQ